MHNDPELGTVGRENESVELGDVERDLAERRGRHEAMGRGVRQRMHRRLGVDGAA